MRRRDFIALAGATVAWPFAAMAQQAGRMYRLGVLAPFPKEAPFNVAFYDEMRSLGFVEGRNLMVDYRVFARHLDMLSQYAAELVQAKPDVIYAGGGVAVRAIQQATKNVPILGITDDMVGEGLIASFARPDGNT